MPIQGNVRDFNMTSLFNLLNLGKRTGMLTVVRKTPEHIRGTAAKTTRMEYAKVAFHRGNLVYAAVTSHDNRLATLLFKAGKLTEPQTNAIYAQTQKHHVSDKALAMRLIGSHIIGRNDVLDVIRDHTMAVLYTIMSWSEGQFRFANNIKLSGDIITAPIDLKNILVGWARETQKIAEINAVVPDLNASLRLPQNPRMKFKGIHLSVEEWKVVANIDPKITIRQIMKHLNMSELEIKKIIYGLVQVHLVYVVPPRPKRETTRAGRQQGQFTSKPDKSVINKLIAWVKS